MKSNLDGETQWMSDSLFSFLDEVSPNLAQLGREIEACVWTDPRTALIRSGIFANEWVKSVLEKEKEYIGADLSVLRSHYERFHCLSQQGIWTDEIERKLDVVLTMGNRAVQDASLGDVNDALRVYKLIFDLAAWYLEVYGPANVAAPDFRYPKRSCRTSPRK